MSKELKFAPREIFEEILEWGVIPTFDLIIELQTEGVVIVRRKIEPYANTWALPGLRMMKPESISDTLQRIAKNELGLRIDVTSARIIGQYVGRFKTELNRQDLSTGYIVTAASSKITLNEDHFTTYKIIADPADIPAKIGTMYKYYLECYFDSSR